jgi:thioredoxin
MKATFKATVTALVAILMMTACGNAGARNEKKNKEADAAKKEYVTELTTETFKTLVYDLSIEDAPYLGDKPAIVDFNATWCGPCQRIAPILEELAKEYEGQITIYKVDVDKEKGLAHAFNVSSIPAVLYIPLEGEPVMTVGARGKERFKEEIKTLLLKK